VGPVVPVQVRAVDYTDAANSTLVLETPLPAGFIPLVANDTFFAGGPFATQAATALFNYVNTVGPGRGKYADPGDPWDDTIRNGRLIQIVQDTLDTDGSRMANVVVNGATIAVGTGPPLVQDVQAPDAEILVALFVIVTQGP
jgi:hypothetical protein